MLHRFIKRPSPSHLKRQSVSFTHAEVGNVCFNDDVEISVYDINNKEVHKQVYSGFVFANSLVEKETAMGEKFLVFKL